MFLGVVGPSRATERGFRMRAYYRLLPAALILAFSAPAANAATVTMGGTSGHALSIAGDPPIPLTFGPPTSQYKSDSFGRGAGYNSSVLVDGNSVFFQAASMSSGSYNASQSISQVDVAIAGLAPGETVSSLTSTIFQSAFGFYIGSFGPTPPCSGAILPSCGAVNSGLAFADFSDSGANAPKAAGAKFSFDVLVDGVLQRSIGGSLLLETDGLGGYTVTRESLIDGVAGDISLLGGALNGFELIEDNPFALTYGWQQGDFTVDFLNPIETSGTVTYRIITESWSEALPLANSVNSIIAFSCFADPIGRGSTHAALFTLNSPKDTCDNYVVGPNETPGYELKFKGIKDGRLILTGSIPEADTWVMLIAGFGLVGLSLRRRQTELRANS